MKHIINTIRAALNFLDNRFELCPGGTPEIESLRKLMVELEQQKRPDFEDEWKGYLVDGETPFERFLRERYDLNALTKLYQRALEENERLKTQQQTDAVRIYDYVWPQTEKHASWCASRSMLMSNPPQSRPCDCKPHHKTAG